MNSHARALTLRAVLLGAGVGAAAVPVWFVGSIAVLNTLSGSTLGGGVVFAAWGSPFGAASGALLGFIILHAAQRFSRGPVLLISLALGSAAPFLALSLLLLLLFHERPYFPLGTAIFGWPIAAYGALVAYVLMLFIYRLRAAAPLPSRQTEVGT